MAITNRSLDVTQQREVIQSNFAATATGATVHVAVIPRPCTLDGIRAAAIGLSGSPAAEFRILRFITGAGVTTIAGVATTLAFTAVGTSGVQSGVIASAGSTLLNLMANDIVTCNITGANSNVLGLSVALVVKNTQDIRTSFGL